MSEFGIIQVSYSARGIARYALEISHSGLNKYEVVKGDNSYVVKQKAEAKMAQWDEAWAKKQDANKRLLQHQNSEQSAIEQTEEAQREYQKLNNILAHTLTINDTVDWNKLKNLADYDIPQPQEEPPPIKPNSTDDKYKPKFTLLDYIFSSRKAAKNDLAAKLYKYDMAQYESCLEKIKTEYAAALKKWQQERDLYYSERDEHNALIDAKHDKYWSGDVEAIKDYCDIVLSNSEYPDYFPQSYSLEYVPQNKMLVIDYQLPSLKNIPSVIEYKYIKVRKEIVEKKLSQSQFNGLYDSIIYQIVIRTLHEIFESDVIDEIKMIAFNGYVQSIDVATGKDTNGCIVTIQTTKKEFGEINLEKVDPKACFKKLKGIGSSQLHSITPVAPIVRLDTTDKRFIDAKSVVNTIDSGSNLAAMDWEDFEHLIRELFEKEFTVNGGEVKVTRASRDGGVDAVAFDPDPIKGGKIVIQAKRYTNTVGVSAVRDLYGTLINEGANKGILVTTTDYGPDAYDFAKGKPISLLNGGNLLHLLAKNGYKAKIDIAEAKSQQINKLQ